MDTIKVDEPSQKSKASAKPEDRSTTETSSEAFGELNISKI